MIFKTLLTFILICTVAVQNFAQSTVSENVILKGFVLDKDANSPLAYVSVGILNKPIGTVADTAGCFNFNIGKENFTDTIQVSIVGYSTLKLSVKDFMSHDDKTIKLFVKFEPLPEVTITN